MAWPWDVSRRFVGRTSERARIAEALARGARLIVITGPPGVGKTRLALEAIEDPLVLSLATTRREELASAMSIASAEPRTVLLDGADAVAAALPAHLDTLLHTTEHRFFITSRHRLRHAAATHVELAPLSTSAEGPSEALELLLARLGPLAPRDAVSLAHAHAIIVASGGLPLVIELAAADARVLGLAEVAERSRAHARTRGAALLREAVDRSWSALSAEDRVVLEIVALLRHGASVHDVEAVAPLPAARVIGALDSLVERSLLRRWHPDDASEAPLHECPSPIREAVLDLALASSESPSRRAQLSQRLLARAAAGELSTPAEIANGLDAVDAALAERGHRAIDALHAILGMRSAAGGTLSFARYAEAIERVRAALASQTGPLIGRLDAALVHALRRGGRVREAIDVAERSHAKSRDPESRYLLAIERGRALNDAGAFEEALEVLRDLQQQRAPSDPDRAQALRALAVAQLRLYDNDAADATLKLALEVASPDGRVPILVNLGDVAAERGHGDEARARYEQARRSAGPAPRPFDAFVALKEAAILQDEMRFEEAIEAYGTAIRDALARGDGLYAAAARLYRGLARLARGDAAEGARDLATAAGELECADDRHHVTICAAGRAVAALRLGLLADAKRHALEAVARARSGSRVAGVIADTVAGWVELADPAFARPHARVRATLLELPGPRDRVFPEGSPPLVTVTIDARALQMARGAAEPASPITSQPVLAAHPAGDWLVLPSGERLAAPRQQASLRIVACLVYAAVRDPEAPVAPAALIAAAWPTEKLVGRAGLNRLHVAIHKTRGWELGSVIERVGRSGYRLRPSVPLELGV